MMEEEEEEGILQSGLGRTLLLDEPLGGVGGRVGRRIGSLGLRAMRVLTMCSP